ncbi:protein takeout [Anabrus simplex]|uniref:protein takeout n=1 Tax=Anabrus simplex TaxID=316456 RepID=UPI0035A33E8A
MWSGLAGSCSTEHTDLQTPSNMLGHSSAATTVLLIVIPTLLLLQDTSALKAGDFFKVCRRSDPKLNDCIKDTINALRPALKKGISELKISSAEPMKVPKVQVFQGTGPVSIDSVFTDLTIQGITQYEVKSASADVDKYRVDFEVALPWMYITGNYNISGQILVLPIRGDGDSWSNYTGVTGKASLNGHPETRNGKVYMELDEFKFEIKVDHATIMMNNLFNGNKELGDAMNKFMSDNWEAVFAELKPVVDQAISAILKDVAQKVFKKFPYEELFPK